MNTTNMRHKDLTFDISGNRVRLKPTENYYEGERIGYELRIEGITEDTLTIPYIYKVVMLKDLMAFNRLFFRLQQLQPKSWGNYKGVMSRGEIKLMRLAILCGGISVLTCLVWLLVQLFK